MSHRFSTTAATLARAFGAAGVLMVGACAPTPPALAPAPAPQTVSVRTVTERSGEVERTGTQRVISSEELTATAAAAPRAFAASRTTSFARSAAGARPTAAPTAGAAGTTIWRGSYEAGTYARRGALALLLSTSPAGIDGGVVAWRVAPAPAGSLGHAAANDAASLVRAPIVSAARDGDRVVLHVDSFYDAGCNCTARATFRGVVRGDTLSGRFTVDGAATMVSEQRGRWRAVRVTAEP